MTALSAVNDTADDPPVPIGTPVAPAAVPDLVAAPPPVIVPGPVAPLDAPATPRVDRGRLVKLLEAMREVNGDLSLTDVLARVVATACELVDAECGGLGVLADDGELQHVVAHGVADPTPLADLPGPLPGLFASVAADGVHAVDPVRLADLTLDVRMAELGRRRPTLRAFLAVPIRHRGELVGEMYLCDPEVDHFSAADEELATALAASAATAIANARLYEESRRSHDWLSASSELARALLAEADDDMLLEVVSHALAVAEADAAALVLPTHDGRGLRVARAIGLGVEPLIGYEFADETELAHLISAGDSALVGDLMTIVRGDYANDCRFGPFMVVPMIDAQGVRGSILLSRLAGRVPFTPRDLEFATGYATQVALALELNDARNDAAWMRTLEVRHEIAQSLHDNVIQRLFAVGVGLQGLAEYSAAARALPPELTERLDRYVCELDDTIVEVRERVFGLRRGDTGRRRSGRFPRLRRDGAAEPDEATGPTAATAPTRRTATE